MTPVSTFDLSLLPVVAAGVIAEIQVDVLGRSLLIAAVVISPYAIYKMRQVSRTRAETAELIRAATAPPESEVRPRLEDVIESIHLVAADPATHGHTIRVARDMTVDGTDAPATLVDALVRDALRRSGLVATAEIETAEARILEVAPSDAGAAARDAGTAPPARDAGTAPPARDAGTAGAGSAEASP